MKLGSAPWLIAALGLLASSSCSSSSSTDAPTGPVGGAVMSAADAHCAGQPVGVSDPAVCKSTTPASSGDGAAAGAGGAPSTEMTAAAGAGPVDAMGAAGAPACTFAHDADYGETLFNSSGDDDDCKYQIAWTATPIRKGENVTFTVTASSKATGAPLERIDAQRAGALALSRVEPYFPCDPTHLTPAADLHAPITETAPGVFSVGPIVFDQSGRWVVRFHFYEECYDSETSPHGHAAFFVDVP